MRPLTPHVAAAFTTLLLAFTMSLPIMAEDIPLSYYDDIEGKSDSVLKSELSRICRGGVRYDYGANSYHSTNNPPEWLKGDLKSFGTWQAFPVTDMREDGTIWDMYSNSMRYFPSKRGDSGCSLNIEHCLPKSWWGGAVNDAYKDLYNLNPSDQRANGQKSNYPPGHVKRGDKFDNGSFRMDSKNSSGYGYICFEPAAEYRGDFARAYFYIATAYESLDWTAYTSYISSATYLMFSDSIQKVLLDWHRADPVSSKEICRADRISTIQHNRNPFIDYPELVEYIWGNKKGTVVSLSSLVCTAGGSSVCHDYVPPRDTLHLYDTLINLPAVTAALVNAVEGGSAIGVQSNGTASATMGSGSTDGQITFSGLTLTDTAVLVFRASPYNSASSMQLDVYADESLLRSIQETVVQETRNEVRYRLTVPAGTSSLRLISVGGGTSKRACLQELYLLTPRQNIETRVESGEPREESGEAVKVIVNGRLLFRHSSGTYDILGRRR